MKRSIILCMLFLAVFGLGLGIIPCPNKEKGDDDFRGGGPFFTPVVWAQELDPSTSSVFWRAEAVWHLDSPTRRWEPRPFTITLFSFSDGSGYWAEYRPENGSTTWAYTAPVKEKVELKRDDSGRYFSMSGGYKYFIDELRATYETRPTAQAKGMKKTGGM